MCFMILNGNVPFDNDTDNYVWVGLVLFVAICWTSC